MFTAANVGKTLKPFKGLTFDIMWTGGAGGTSVFTTTKVSTTTNSNGELGLVFSGKQGVGSYAEKALDQITEYFDATDSSALLAGCASAQTVTSPTFDQSNSVAIL